MKPDIILDIAPEFEQFKKKTRSVPNHKEFIPEMIDAILEHIYNEEEAEANLIEFAVLIKEQHMQAQEPMSEEDAEKISQAVHDFALVLFQQLRDHGAYSDDGEFAYKLGEFVTGQDFVLTPMGPEDFIG